MDFAAARAQLVKHLSRDIRDRQVLEIMGRIPRELFVPPEYRNYAYDNIPLPIGAGQTISQPYIIALMTQALVLTGKEKVLEVGTGSGYQAAIISHLARMLISTERTPSLAETAKKVLDSLGYRNINIFPAEDTLGWVKMSPYDAIIVTAAAPKIPEALISQLAIGGSMIIPVGTRYLQELCKLTRHEQENTIENLGGCRFVPLIGNGAWENEG